MDRQKSAARPEADSDEDEVPLAVSLYDNGGVNASPVSDDVALTHEESHKVQPVPATIITGCLGAGELDLTYSLASTAQMATS